MAYRLDLDSAWAKVWQASNHRDSLKDKLGLDYWQEAPVFRPKANRVRILAQYNKHTGEHSVRVKAVPDRLLAAIAMEFGDAIHNLRSALDHLAWQLALERYGGNRPPKPWQIYFPVCDTRDEFNEHRAIAHFDPARSKLMRHFQPYNGLNGRTIRTINTLDIRDKHQELLAIGLLMSDVTPFPVRAISVSVKRSKRGGWVKVGTEVSRVRFDTSDPNFKVKMESDLTPLVLLPRRGHPVAFLSQATEVVSGVIDAFQNQSPPLVALSSKERHPSRMAHHLPPSRG